MMKRLAGGKTSRRILSSYLLVSLVPILFLGIVFSLQQFRSERAALLNQYEKSTSQAALSFDRMIDDIQSIASHFSVQYAAGEFEDPALMHLQFIAYTESFGLPGNLFFYKRGEQSIQSVDGEIDYSAFMTMYGFGNELNMVSFYTKLNTTVSAQYLPSKGFDGASHYFIYMQPVPMLSNTPEGVLIYILNLDSIHAAMLDSLGNFEGCFAVFTADHQNVYLLNETSWQNPNDLSLTLNQTRGTSWQRRSVRGSTFETLRVITDKRGFAYALALSEEWLFAPLRRKITAYGAIIAAFMLLAGGVALLIARSQYRPVEKLAASLSIDQEDDGALFDAINHSLREIRNENENLVLQLHSYTQDARSRFLGDLVTGKILEPDALALAMRASGIRFSATYFCVMVFNVRSEERRGREHDPELYFTEADFPGGRAFALPIDSENRLALLVNTENQSEKALLRTAELFRSRLNSLMFDSAPDFGVSSVRGDLLRVGRQLFEAFAALENKTSIYAVRSGNSLQSELQEAELFRQSLLYGNEQSVNRSLSHILDVADREHWALDRRQMLYFRLVNTLVNVSFEKGLSIDPSELTALASAASRSELEAALSARAHWLCAHMEEQKNQAGQALNQRIIDFIYEHFTDNMLSLDMVADAFSLSESTVRKVVRETTGTTFSNYVTTLRLSFVKKQLAETELPVKTIAEHAGYIDVSSFTRKFRTLEGVTPGQYRAAIHGNGNHELE
ncbi:MAG: helix-turn-helix transcriptional regulator [Clostridia bacterium]|nr:helix-turn-helix transcriptional regulator [Clostridia bacterium]